MANTKPNYLTSIEYYMFKNTDNFNQSTYLKVEHDCQMSYQFYWVHSQNKLKPDFVVFLMGITNSTVSDNGKPDDDFIGPQVLKKEFMHPLNIILMLFLKKAIYIDWY